MSHQDAVTPRSDPWGDRFQTPTAEELVSCLAAADRDVVRGLLARVTSAGGWAKPGKPAAAPGRAPAGPDPGSEPPVTPVAVRVQWRGVWKWTVAVTRHGQAWVFVVPDPKKPRVSMAVRESLLSDLPVKKVGKGIREALQRAPVVGDTRWPVWDGLTPAFVDDLVRFADLLAAAECGVAAAASPSGPRGEGLPSSPSRSGAPRASAGRSSVGG